MRRALARTALVRAARRASCRASRGAAPRVRARASRSVISAWRAARQPISRLVDARRSRCAECADAKATSERRCIPSATGKPYDYRPRAQLLRPPVLRRLPPRRHEQRVVERRRRSYVLVVLVEHQLPLRPDLDARGDPAAAAALVVHEADVLHLRRVARRRLQHAHEHQALGVDPELLAVVVTRAARRRRSSACPGTSSRARASDRTLRGGVATPCTTLGLA